MDNEALRKQFERLYKKEFYWERDISLDWNEKKQCYQHCSNEKAWLIYQAANKEE